MRGVIIVLLLYYCTITDVIAGPSDNIIRSEDFVRISLWSLHAPSIRVKNVLDPEAGELTSTAALETASIFQIFDATTKRAKQATTILKSGASIYIRAADNTSSICFASPYMACESMMNTTKQVFRILDKHSQPVHNLAHGNYIKIRKENSAIDCNTDPKTKFINCDKKSNDPSTYGFILLKEAVLQARRRSL